MKNLIQIAKQYNKEINEVVDIYSKYCYRIGYRYHVYKKGTLENINEQALERVDRYYRLYTKNKS